MIKAVAFVHPRFKGMVDDVQIFCEEVIAAGLSSAQTLLSPASVDFDHFVNQDPQMSLDVLIVIVTSEYSSEDDRLARLGRIIDGFADLFKEVNAKIRFNVDMPPNTPYKSKVSITDAVDGFMAKALDRARQRSIERLTSEEGLLQELDEIEQSAHAKVGGSKSD